jgi:UDP-glucose:(heptosyl)LPS alpha-1,3-glucosyltransferase
MNTRRIVVLETITPELTLIKRKYDPKGGGAERVAARFVSGFLGKGYKITLIGETCTEPESERFRFVRVARSPLAFGFGRTYAFHRAVQAELERRPGSFVYAMSRTFPVDVFRVTEQLHFDWLRIGYSPLQRFNPRHRSILALENRMFDTRNIPFLVANSQMVKNRIVEEKGYPDKRITVVRNGIDPKLFFPAADSEQREAIRSRFGIAADELVLLFVADNFRIKGLFRACEAVAGLDDKAVRLFVVGGDDPAPFRSACSRFGIADRVAFLGRRNDLRDLYVAADLLFYPTLYEPFANVCLEAAACALPILTTRTNGASELVETGKCGYIIRDADSIREMRDCIAAFARLSRSERDTLGNAALDVSCGYRWERHIDEIEGVFLRAFEERTCPAR